MLLSVVIPTRERPDTLHYALASVLSPACPALEVVVMDNCSGPETRAVVEAFADERVKYCRSGERLAMSDNWELGLAQATGDYVFFLGDDDALMPDGLALALDFLTAYPVPILSWSRSFYYWPNAQTPYHQNRLYLNLESTIQLQVSWERLQRFYEGQIDYGQLPMIYNSFIHRSIIEQVKQQFGRYFLSPIPDVYSGIINAYFSEGYVVSQRPISLGATSGHSTGASQLFPELNPLPNQLFLQEQKTVEPIHPSLVPSWHLLMLIEDVKLKTKARCFPDEALLQVNYPQLILNMLQSLNDNPQRYEETLGDILNLAAKHELSIGVIPPPRPQPAVPYQGPMDNFTKLAINCEQAGITDVLQATRFAQALLHPVTSLLGNLPPEIPVFATTGTFSAALLTRAQRRDLAPLLTQYGEDLGAFFYPYRFQSQLVLVIAQHLIEQLELEQAWNLLEFLSETAAIPAYGEALATLAEFLQLP